MFCCGLAYKTLDEYKQHILERHEEGKDFIVCPLKHCGFPVRDLKAHFLVKHKGISLPNTEGMRSAILWRDFNPVTNKIKIRRPKFREGYYKSGKMGTMFYYRSSYELAVYECLDIDVDVTSFEVEPFEIPYIYKGKSHKYIPDIVVKYIDGTIKLLEIKPSSQSLLEVNQCKWSAAERACQTRGWIFEVVTEVGIGKLKQKIRNQKIIYG